MIQFKKFTLSNGLRLIVHEDTSTPMAVVDVLYDVGAKDENPQKTGFAHLFEHLMFGGSVNIPCTMSPCSWQAARTTPTPPTILPIIIASFRPKTWKLLSGSKATACSHLPSAKKPDVQRKVVCEDSRSIYQQGPTAM